MDVESSTGQLVESIDLDKNQSIEGSKGIRTVTKWKRRAATEGRLVRMEVQNQALSSLGNHYQSAPQQSLKRNREIMEVKSGGSLDWSWMIFVYLSTDKPTREKQWEFLVDSKQKWGPCWLIAGDWNDLTSNEEKRGGQRRLESSFQGFKQFISDMEMQEMEQKGAFFTWGNNRTADGYVEERLDKVFTSWNWQLMFPKMEVSNFYRTASDHNVLLITTDTAVSRKRKMFLFDKQWIKMEGVQEAVKEGWNISVEGSRMFQALQGVMTSCNIYFLPLQRI
ncbi:F8M12.22 protein [Striga asiatica]|uniref:F8M12.22 protein n=1 Tax=Striga asiatica TaxID=4170 RepID=A0A5A7PX86_STRAF|nr:F8M12.22 protein [Striga asiatica]